jgi:hypothetical protein
MRSPDTILKCHDLALGITSAVLVKSPLAIGIGAGGRTRQWAEQGMFRAQKQQIAGLRDGGLEGSEVFQKHVEVGVTRISLGPGGELPPREPPLR